VRRATRISERITTQNRETLGRAGTRYECDELGCEAEPTYVCRITGERTPTEERSLWLCGLHLRGFSRVGS
jgi:hypothetical protein